jgi:hypothetical protein
VRRFIPSWRGTWRDLVTRALRQRERLNPGLPADRKLSLHQCIDLQRFVFEAEQLDGLDPASLAQRAVMRSTHAPQG